MTSRNEQSRSCGYRTFISQQRMFPVGRRLPRYVHGTVSALYRTSRLQYRRSAVVPQTRHLQTHLEPYSHQLAIDKLQVTHWAVIICANTAESAPESRATDILVSRQIQSTRDGSCEHLHPVTASLGYLIIALDVAGSSGFPSSG